MVSAIEKIPKCKVITSGSIHDIKATGIYYLTSQVSDLPDVVGGIYIVSSYNETTLTGLFINTYNENVYHVRYDGVSWTTTKVNLSKVVSIGGTTTSSGALEVPSAYRNMFFISAVMTSASGFVFRRDAGYFTVMNNSMQPMANTAVTFDAIFM